MDVPQAQRIETRPVVPKTLGQKLGHALMRSFGWRVEIQLPEQRKCVLIGAPHTSNWDFLIMLMLRMCAGVPFHFIGKVELFRGPMGWLFRKLGGIPVDRRRRANLVSQIVESFNQRDQMMLVITPEATRSRSDYWKSGFYHIARQAGVPIALGYVDFSRRQTGIGPCFMPSGNIESDMAMIRDFYADKVGKFPENQGQVRLRPPGEQP
jgi:1-acyl-sn-glycerol-3-phosphate acyltransferase